MIGCHARIRCISGDRLEVVDGEVTAHHSQRLHLRAGSAAGVVGSVGVVEVRGKDGEIYRARAQVETRSELGVELLLHETLAIAERRLYARATVPARLRFRMDASASPLSVVGGDDPWQVEVIEISPSGMLTPLDQAAEVGQRLALDLHIPGPGGGERLSVTGEVARLFPDRPSPAAAIRFVDPSHAVCARLAAVVDRELLGIDLF